MSFVGTGGGESISLSLVGSGGKGLEGAACALFEGIGSGGTGGTCSRLDDRESPFTENVIDFDLFKENDRLRVGCGRGFCAWIDVVDGKVCCWCVLLR